jgi:rubrerythrin
MDFTTTLDILRFAIEREDEAARAYSDLAFGAADPVLRGLLLELQSDEKNHKRLLQNIVDGKAEALEVGEVQDLQISDYLLEEPFGASSSIQDLLIFAAKKEEKAAELYGRMRDAAADPELRRLLVFLVQQEKGHKLKLEQIYEKEVLQED